MAEKDEEFKKLKKKWEKEKEAKKLFGVLPGWQAIKEYPGKIKGPKEKPEKICAMCGRPGVKKVKGLWYCKGHADIQERRVHQVKEEKQAKKEEVKEKKPSKWEKVKGGLGKAKITGGKLIKKQCTNPKCGWSGATDAKKCPICGMNLKRAGLTDTGNIIKFFVFFGSILGSLFFVFKPAMDLIFSLVSEALITYLGSTALASFAIYGGVTVAALLIALWLSSMDLKWGVGGCLAIIFLMILGPALFTVGMNIVIPGGILGQELRNLDFACYIETLFSGHPEDMQYCYTTPKETGPPEYSGDKIYEMIKINLGDEMVDRYGKTYYNIPTPYASTEDDKDPYELPFYVENVNEEDDISEFQINQVGFYMNKSRFYWFEAKAIDRCFTTLCPIEAEDKIKIYAEEFEDSNGNYPGYIPCENESFYRIYDFRIRSTYTHNVNHTGKLTIVRSKDDELRVPKEAYLIEAPTNGPVDLLINFESPYTMGERSDNTVRMGVWIVNRGSGWFSFLDSTLTITGLGNQSIGSWIGYDSGDCIVDGNEIRFENSLDPGKIIYSEQAEHLSCKLQIKETPGDPFQIVYLKGTVNYEYHDTRYFTPSHLSINRCGCPGEECEVEV